MNRSGQYYVYILANKPYGALYTGITNDLLRRVYEHKCGLAPGFSSKHRVCHLVYYVTTESPEAAIAREKQIKTWKRHWKLRIINEFNPQWRDLYYDLVNRNEIKWIPASAGMTAKKED